MWHPMKKLCWTLLSAVRAKMKEIEAGVDGFLVFDPDLVQPLLEVGEANTI